MDLLQTISSGYLFWKTTVKEANMLFNLKDSGLQGLQQLKYMAMLIGAMSLAGSSVVVGKVLTASTPVFITTFTSLLIALICMLPLMRGRYHELRSLNKTQWKYLFLQGLCGIVLFRAFTLWGLKSTGAVQAGIITGTTPAVLAILSLFLLGERLTYRSSLSISLTIGGCLLINITSGTDSDTSLFGCLLVGIAVVCEALFTIFRKRVAESVSAVTNTAVLIFCSLLLVFIPALREAWTLHYIPDWTAVTAIFYYGVFATFLAYMLWTSAVGHVSGATAGAATAAMPASSVILAACFLGEDVCGYHLIGCMLIILGILLSSTNLSFFKKRPQSALP